jgi:hypothetical protein
MHVKGNSVSSTGSMIKAKHYHLRYKVLISKTLLRVRYSIVCQRVDLAFSCFDVRNALDHGFIRLDYVVD